MEVDGDAGLLELRQWDGSLLRTLRSAALPARGRSRRRRVPDRLRGGRAPESWAVFERLRREGVVPPGLALPGLPAHADVERLHVREPARPRRLPARLRALAAARARPDRGRHPSRRSLHPVGHLPGGAGLRELFPDASRATTRSASSPCSDRLGAAVPADVELGYHLCYGSPADQHLVMPKDTAILAELAGAIFARVRRPRRLPPPAGAARARRRCATSRRCADSRLPRARRASTSASSTTGTLAGDRRRIDAARGRGARRSGWPPSAAGAAASRRGCDGLLESHRRAVDYLVSAPPDDRHHARPRVAHVLLAAPPPALRGLGQPRQAAAAHAPRRPRPLPQLGLGRRRARGTTGTSSRRTCAATATASGPPTAATP